MGMPAAQNLNIYQGDTFTFTFRLKDSTGAYIDLTGSTPTAQMRSTATSPTILATFTAALLSQTTTPGGVQLTLAPATTAALSPISNATWDVQLVDGAGNVTTYLRGAVTVEAEVTR